MIWYVTVVQKSRWCELMALSLPAVFTATFLWNLSPVSSPQYTVGRVIVYQFRCQGYHRNQKRNRPYKAEGIRQNNNLLLEIFAGESGVDSVVLCTGYPVCIHLLLEAVLRNTSSCLVSSDIPTSIQWSVYGNVVSQARLRQNTSEGLTADWGYHSLYFLK